MANTHRVEMGARNAVTLNGLMVGLDWNEVDETLDSLKLKEKEAAGLSDGSSFGKRSFGSGKRSERSWRKPVDVDVRPQRLDGEYHFSRHEYAIGREKYSGICGATSKNGNIEHGK
ncbi:hypothetical protein AgCh_023091 [Apium graveolens]